MKIKYANLLNAMTWHDTEEKFWMTTSFLEREHTNEQEIPGQHRDYYLELDLKYYDQNSILLQ